MSNLSTFEFSCLENVSDDSIYETEWTLGDVSNGYAISAIMILYLLIGLPWNMLVVGIIIKKRLFAQPPLMLMLNLSITNFLIFIFIMPYNIITGLVGEYIFGSSDRVRCHMCQMGIAIIILPIVSMHTLALMAIDRFVYLKRPLIYHRIVTPRRMLLAILFVWILCILLAIPPLFGFGEIRFSHSVATCIILIGRRTRIAPNYFYILALLMEGAIPFVTICVMYVWILCITRTYLMQNLSRVLASGRGLVAESRSDILKEYSKNQVLLVKVFAAVITANIIIWLPLVPLVISVAVLEPDAVPTIAFTIAYLSYMSRIVIHPILEACLTHEIRMTLKEFWSRLRKRT